MVIEPTPPAPPITKIVVLAGAVFGTCRRSNSISQAVIAVKGRAAASVASKIFGL
ncbi:Uncharacterised protein [Acinetobacter baumannii]|nr:Uncharacterised protein [Acinetobacter baumannii]